MNVYMECSKNIYATYIPVKDIKYISKLINKCTLYFTYILFSDNVG